MKYVLFHVMALAVILPVIAGMSVGCASRINAALHSDATRVDDGHGLLVGTHRLNAEDQSRLLELKWSTSMKWWLEEVSYGKRSLIVRLPLDGSFAVKLPAGSYRVTKIVFDSSRGKWHAVLPTAFEIKPRECTSLGTSEFQVEPGFLTGRITRQVLSGQEGGSEDREWMKGEERCPTTMVQLESPMTRSVRLGLNEKRLDRVF